MSYIKLSELRIGNWVMLPKYWADRPIRVTGVTVVDRTNDHTGIYEEFLHLNEYDVLDAEYFDEFVDYKNGVAAPKDLVPIPLTEQWLNRMEDNSNKAPFPDWIKYVHEAQNWYYWNNNKTELEIKDA